MLQYLGSKYIELCLRRENDRERFKWMESDTPWQIGRTGHYRCRFCLDTVSMQYILAPLAEYIHAVVAAKIHHSVHAADRLLGPTRRLSATIRHVALECSVLAGVEGFVPFEIRDGRSNGDFGNGCHWVDRR